MYIEYEDANALYILDIAQKSCKEEISNHGVEQI